MVACQVRDARERQGRDGIFDSKEGGCGHAIQALKVEREIRGKALDPGEGIFDLLGRRDTPNTQHKSIELASGALGG
jgi:hypothetical protein